MSSRRLSMLSTASTQIVAIILLAGFLPGARAWCQDDGDGVETCYGLSTTGIYVISIVGAAIALTLLSTLIACRRRQIQRANLAQIKQAQAGAIYVAPMAAPQYPPTHNGDPNQTTVTSVRSVTLEYYVPPPGELPK